MKPISEIISGVFQLAGDPVSGRGDAFAGLVDLDGELVLIDTGAQLDAAELLANLSASGYEPSALSRVVLTHAHLDHIGGAPAVRRQTGARLLIHEADLAPLRDGDPERTAARWYGVDFPPTEPDQVLNGAGGNLGGGLKWLHTPGHTPGSIVLYLDRDGQRVLFGQDIHGPFYAAFGSDVDAWRKSMKRVLALDADILCEGHFGVYRGAKKVRRYIEGYLVVRST
uniref:Glyoxylase, beta-lactamase superfamily II n=1 Tax=Candidatus Kentrum sp. FM TaxID=2126340 RepID=A0A450S4H5_9GAMM|nr:MAG: Glyoxylase, beta-lactamase superfamily II [Candidatus Kentron sp. FM]VFJ55885.1 MAG: Glyoxylase, beta-lactamase superfamily II [Candidatus Kentron sp. FM]VFK07118.1 MAG: Glyoxylase, beta-lactamase superfamily II [Candidatus Kentron sp. FM]